MYFPYIVGTCQDKKSSKEIENVAYKEPQKFKKECGKEYLKKMLTEYNEISKKKERKARQQRHEKTIKVKKKIVKVFKELLNILTTKKDWESELAREKHFERKLDMNTYLLNTDFLKSFYYINVLRIKVLSSYNHFSQFPKFAEIKLFLRIYLEYY